jgi:DedD protein
MERELKERIIGAVVLVVVVVLVVPIFLDGRTEDGETVTESVTLPGQSEQKMQTQVLNRNRSTPVPANNSNEETPKPQSETPTPKVVVQQESAAPQPEESTPTAESRPDPQPVTEKPAAASDTGMFAVQLGSFGSEENANKLAADLRKQGFAAFLSKLEAGGKELHRVRVGPQANRKAAEEVAAKLATAGHKGQVVPHP